MSKPNNNRADRGRNRKSGNAPILDKAQQRETIAKELNISRKTKEFYDEIIDNPKQKNVEAYLKTHEPKSIQSAHVQSSRLLNSDKYHIYKASAVGKAKRRIVSLVDSDNQNIALKASQDILDRTEGKAIQRNETTSKTVEVKLDLSGLRLGAHHVRPEHLMDNSINP